MSIEGDMGTLGIVGNNGDSGYGCGFLGNVGSDWGYEYYGYYVL